MSLLPSVGILETWTLREGTKNKFFKERLGDQLFDQSGFLSLKKEPRLCAVCESPTLFHVILEQKTTWEFGGKEFEEIEKMHTGGFYGGTDIYIVCSTCGKREKIYLSSDY